MVDIFIQQLLNGLIVGSIYALIALGYTMVYGIMQLINFAHGEIVMIGAMVTITCINILLGAGVQLPGPLVLLAGLTMAIPISMLLGFTIWDVRKMQQKGPLAPYASALEVALWGCVVCALSGGFTYTWWPYILMGLVVAMKHISATLPPEGEHAAA